MELRRRQTHSESLAENGRRARAHSRSRRDEPGSFAAWIQIRRLNDLLRVDAGGWHGQRSPRDMSTTRQARWRASSEVNVISLYANSFFVERASSYPDLGGDDRLR